MQRTILRATSFSGVGLHSGQNVHVNLLPSDENSGIVFRRIDLQPSVDIPALALSVTETTMCSCVSMQKDDKELYVRTIEHIMCAFALMGIDNIIVEVSADEIPIMDGSAAPFIDIIQNAGICEQRIQKKYIKVLKPITIVDGDKKASVLPYSGFRINFEIDFAHPVIKSTKQTLQTELNADTYVNIAKARSFGFIEDIDYLRKNNLALGGSLDNVIVLSDNQVLNTEGLRFDDEFVRHKVLDAIGDLYLAGSQILGDFYAYKSGHHLNNQMVRAILANPNKYEVVTEDEINFISYPSVLQVAEAC